ncbi:MAG: peptidase M16 domain-containing protein [Candidatus Peregrinibacteria bacterium GW2011_GWF2_33_10]|nr:MAG: peptidase M16 domain-containing protein [Candidatus Peregrinibacteria bacterium GW2011_GWF2_33_10]OGJ44821.1 MAG: hypothetical protein A2263_06310 [Candidatus Peregrinibacteria bacterium RIFOXYA2_FULL_33_21]OGJ47107.1 MAG: hypothetical protein A2272_03030 [Candidatus Peregrinibacteria bacterium RIFOXYA12_FULL_33_12]OGJ50507.1 MAG: hypothetical protein A2307_02935 [Candidatus Peregrinibacteria bacterium RIFOXYB2_FULL_33_20]
MLNKIIFKNNLRLITKQLIGSKSLTVLILVGAGSRYETQESNGISHFLEHMFFKGAKKYQNAREVSEAIDSVGGEFNAFTGKQYAGYFVKVSSDKLDVALDVLSDMLINSRFNEDDMNREREVILEEYKMYQDTPSYQIGWDFERLLYGKQPMGNDQLGTPEFLKKVSREDLISYHQKLYTPDNTVISIVGDVNQSVSKNLVEKLFIFKNPQKAFNYFPLEVNHSKEKVILRKKYTKQGHVVIGFPGYSETDHRSIWLKILAMILGGNMSSRMFLGVRERKGLAYNICTTTDDYTDTGIISTRAGIDTDRVDEAISAMIFEYKNLKENGVSSFELEKAKSCLKGKILLRLEDTEEFAHLLGKFELLYGQYKNPEEILSDIDRVTMDDINTMIKEILAEEKMKAAIIGPFEEEQKDRFEEAIRW